MGFSVWMPPLGLTNVGIVAHLTQLTQSRWPRWFQQGHPSLQPFNSKTSSQGFQLHSTYKTIPTHAGPFCWSNLLSHASSQPSRSSLHHTLKHTKASWEHTLNHCQRSRDGYGGSPSRCGGLISFLGLFQSCVVSAHRSWRELESHLVSSAARKRGLYLALGFCFGCKLKCYHHSVNFLSLLKTLPANPLMSLALCMFKSLLREVRWENQLAIQLTAYPRDYKPPGKRDSNASLDLTVLPIFLSVRLHLPRLPASISTQMHACSSKDG